MQHYISTLYFSYCAVFLSLSLNLEYQIDMTKELIPYFCNIPSLLLQFDTVPWNGVCWVSMKSQINDKQINSLLLQHYISTPYFWFCSVWFPHSEFKFGVSNRHHEENNSLFLQHSTSTTSFWYCAVKFGFQSFNEV